MTAGTISWPRALNVSEDPEMYDKKWGSVVTDNGYRVSSYLVHIALIPTKVQRALE